MKDKCSCGAILFEELELSCTFCLHRLENNEQLVKE